MCENESVRCPSQFHQQLNPQNVKEHSQFGQSIVMNGGRTAIGSNESIEVFGWNESRREWEWESNIKSTNHPTIVEFGSGIGMEENVIVANGKKEDGKEVVFVFEWNEMTMEWEVEETLEGRTENGESGFGESICIEEEWMIVGSGGNGVGE